MAEDKYADEMLSDDELDGVAGGSWKLTQKEAEKAGITLKKEDGSPGEFTWYYNFGDYYWKGKKISDGEAYDIAAFVKKKGYQPNSVDDAVKFCRIERGGAPYQNTDVMRKNSSEAI